jgi:hypothetical protein
MRAAPAADICTPSTASQIATLAAAIDATKVAFSISAKSVKQRRRI